MRNWLADNLAALAEATGRRLTLPEPDPSVVRVESNGEFPVAHLRTSRGDYVMMHSRRGPMAEARQAVANVLRETTPSTVAVIGAGLGYVVDALLERLPAVRIVVFEPEPHTVNVWLARGDLGGLIRAGQLCVYLGPEYLGVSDTWRVLDTAGTVPPTIVHPLMARERGADVARAMKLLSAAVTAAQGNAEAQRRFAAPYLLNTIRNLGAVVGAPNVDQLHRYFQGVPAIVAGAGPSLPDAYESIARAAGGAVLIAVDTAVRPLLAAGIEPHLCVAVDPGAINARNFVDLPPHGRMRLVAEPSVDARVLAPFPDRLITFRVSDHHPWPWLAGLGLPGAWLRTFGSVVSSALELSIRLGCDPIIFVGIDLSFTNGQPYARGVTYEADWRKNKNDVKAAGAGSLALTDVWRHWIEANSVVMRPDIHDHPAETTRQMEIFRDQIVNRMAEEADRTFVNATGAGILHGGPIRLGSIAETLSTRPATHVRDLVLDRPPGLTASRVLRAASELREALRGCSRLDSAPEPVPVWASFAAGNLTVEDLAGALDAACGSAQVTTPESGQRDVEPGGPEASHAPMLESSRLFWNDRARENSKYYICTGLGDEQHRVTDDAFFASGRHQVETLLTHYDDPAISLKTVVDVGCGIGRCARFLAEHFKLVYAVDFSDEMIRQAAAALAGVPNIRLILNNGRDLREIPDESVDYVFCAYLFQGLHDQSVQSSYLREFGRILRENGRVYMDALVDTHGSLASFVNSRTGPGPSGRPIQLSMIDEICRENDMAIVEIRQSGHAYFPRIYIEKWGS